MRKLGFLARWNVGGRASEDGTWDGFVREGTRRKTVGQEVFFCSDDVQTHRKELVAGVSLTYTEKWSAERGTWVATDLKQTGVGLRADTSWGDVGEEVQQVSGVASGKDAWFERASGDSAREVSVWAIGMKDSALKPTGATGSEGRRW